LVHDCKSAAQIIDDLMAEAEGFGALNLQQMADKNATRSWNV
jgi:hypothetical protein